MKVVVRGERPEKSNEAYTGFPFFWYSVFFILIGSLFFGIGIYMFIVEEPFSSGDPNEVFLSLLSTFCGGVAIAIGIGSFFQKRPKIENKYSLLESGVCVKLPVVSIELANSSMNNLDGYYVECRNLNNEIGCMDIYKSDVIYNVHCLALEPGDLIPIYIDWKNPADFYMDIDGYEKVDTGQKAAQTDVETL